MNSPTRLLLAATVLLTVASGQDKPPRPATTLDQMVGAYDRVRELPSLTEDQRREILRRLTDFAREESASSRPARGDALLLAARARVDDVMTERQRILLARMGPGPLSESRYAHALILDLPNLTPEKRGALERLVAGIEGAESALVTMEDVERRARDAYTKAAVATAAGTPPAEGAVAVPAPPVPLNPPLYQRRTTLQERFWLAIALLITPEDMVAVNAELPHQERRLQDINRKFELVPDLTASQMQRVNARVEQLESESAADRAETDRIRQRQRAKDVTPDERHQLLEEMLATEARMRATFTRVYADLLSGLTPAQRTAFEALPLASRPGNFGRLEGPELRRLSLTPDQRRIVDGEIKATQAIVDSLRKSMTPAKRPGGGEMPEGSPEALMMQAPGNRLRAATTAAQHAMLRRLINDVLTPAQVVDLIMLGLADAEKPPEKPPEPPKVPASKPAAKPAELPKAPASKPADPPAAPPAAKG